MQPFAKIKFSLTFPKFKYFRSLNLIKKSLKFNHLDNHPSQQVFSHVGMESTLSGCLNSSRAGSTSRLDSLIRLAGFLSRQSKGLEPKEKISPNAIIIDLKSL